MNYYFSALSNCTHRDSLIELDSSVIELEVSVIKLESFLIELESSLINLRISKVKELSNSIVVLKRHL